MTGNSVIQRVLSHMKTKCHRIESNSLFVFGVLLAIAKAFFFCILGYLYSSANHVISRALINEINCLKFGIRIAWSHNFKGEKKIVFEVLILLH